MRVRGITLEVPTAITSPLWAHLGPAKVLCSICWAALTAQPRDDIGLGGDDVAQMNDDQLSEVRATRIGMIFQAYNYDSTTQRLWKTFSYR